MQGDIATVDFIGEIGWQAVRVVIPVSSTWPTACHSHCAGVGWIYCNCSGGACLPSVTTKSESCKLWGGLTELSVAEMTPVFPKMLSIRCSWELHRHEDSTLRLWAAICELLPKDSGNTPVKRHASWDNWLVSEMH